MVVENGVVRDFVIGIIIYVMDIYDGEFLEVIQSEIIGGYIIDFYIGEFIFLFEIFFLIGNILEFVTLSIIVILFFGDFIIVNFLELILISEIGVINENKIINGVIRYLVIGQIIYVVDFYDGVYLEVFISLIFGVYVFDFYIGDLIIVEDYVMEFGIVDVQL